MILGCHSKPPQAVKRFGLLMMTPWMNEQMPFRDLKMVSIGSDAQLRVSQQALRRFGLAMMTAWMKKLRPFCDLKMVRVRIGNTF